MKDLSFLFYVLLFFAIILFRYFLVAGCSSYLLYSIRPPSAARHELTPSFPPSRAIGNDILLSVGSAAVFALATAAIMVLRDRDLTHIYSHPGQFGWWYVPCSYVSVLILQDTYFYFTHRIFHHPLLYRWFHRGHHQSLRITPWTSFAFDLGEAVIQSLFLCLIVMVIPLHMITLLAILTTMTIWAVVNHLGMDNLPVSFPHHWLGRWFIGPAHHHIHHRQFRLHYGLYFTFWDRWLGTEDPAYGKMVGSEDTADGPMALP